MLHTGRVRTGFGDTARNTGGPKAAQVGTGQTVEVREHVLHALGGPGRVGIRREHDVLDIGARVEHVRHVGTACIGADGIQRHVLDAIERVEHV